MTAVVTTEDRVRSRRVRWTRKFTPLEAAREHVRTAWEFQGDPTVYVEKLVTSKESVADSGCL